MHHAAARSQLVVIIRSRHVHAGATTRARTVQNAQRRLVHVLPLTMVHVLHATVAHASGGGSPMGSLSCPSMLLGGSPRPKAALHACVEGGALLLRKGVLLERTYIHSRRLPRCGVVARVCCEGGAGSLHSCHVCTAFMFLQYRSSLMLSDAGGGEARLAQNRRKIAVLSASQRCSQSNARPLRAPPSRQRLAGRYL